MNLLQQLEAAKPWEAPSGRRKRGEYVTGPANAAKARIAQKKYAQAIGDAWVGTHVIEDRLGMGRSSALKVLLKQLEQGLVERRPAGGAPFNRRKGWEWKCVK
jgi:hypothetical protein